MKKKFKAFISCLLAVLMLVPTTVAFAATPPSNEIRRKPLCLRLALTAF